MVIQEWFLVLKVLSTLVIFISSLVFVQGVQYGFMMAWPLAESVHLRKNWVSSQILNCPHVMVNILLLLCMPSVDGWKYWSTVLLLSPCFSSPCFWYVICSQFNLLLCLVYMLILSICYVWFAVDGQCDYSGHTSNCLLLDFFNEDNVQYSNCLICSSSWSFTSSIFPLIHWTHWKTVWSEFNWGRLSLTKQLTLSQRRKWYIMRWMNEFIYNIYLIISVQYIYLIYNISTSIPSRDKYPCHAKQWPTPPSH